MSINQGSEEMNNAIPGTLRSEDVTPELGMFAEDSVKLWTKYVRDFAADLNTPEVEIQDRMASPFIYHANTYDRVCSLMRYMDVYVNDLEDPKFADKVINAASIDEWRNIANNHSDQYWPLFGVVKRGDKDFLFIKDSGPQQLEIMVMRGKKEGDNVVTTYRIKDSYRKLVQYVTITTNEIAKKNRMELSAYVYDPIDEYMAREGATMQVNKTYNLREQ